MIKIKRRYIEKIETTFVIFSLFLYTNAVFPVVSSGGHSEGEPVSGGGISFLPSLIYRLFLLIGVISFVFIKPYLKTVFNLAIINKYLLIFTLLALASTVWSGYDKTLLRAISFSCTYLFSIYFAVRYTLKQQLILISKCFLIVLILSIIFVVLLPKYGIMGGIHAGAWRGVFNHKNFLGKMMMICDIVFILLHINKEQRSLSTYFGIFASTILLIMSKSSSSLGNFMVLMVVLLVLRTWRWRFEIMIPALVGTAILSILANLWYQENAAILFASVGKDPSLSGRTDIWGIIYDIGLRKIWLGYGYESFWRGFSGPSAEVWYAHDWHPPHAHNGFLDLFVTLGLVGLIIFIFSFLSSLYQSFMTLRYLTTESEGFWPIISLFFLILSNLTESGLMHENNIYTVIYISSSYSLSIITHNKHQKNYKSLTT
ncbi:MAG: O-antigen ligase family protein [Sphaerospermopsis sp. SIO1G1]|nr:O-antigen ligase family protein [Sphaerospermopsis sp. SIO1G1]